MAHTQRIQRTNLQTQYSQPTTTADYARTTLTFESCAEVCEAWLYLPVGANQPGSGHLPASTLPPVVLMGHGKLHQSVISLHFVYALQILNDGRGAAGISGSSCLLLAWLTCLSSMCPPQ